MSDMSSLTHEYLSASEFSRTLNEAVLIVKKRFARGQSIGGNGEVQAALCRLRNTLSAIIARLDESVGIHTHGTVPEDILERIVESHRGSLPHFQQDLRHVLEVLNAADEIQSRELEFLDALCGAADASAAATFHKLWRR